MTPEEAIARLEDLQVFQHEPKGDDINALGMAIEVLAKISRGGHDENYRD